MVQTPYAPPTAPVSDPPEPPHSKLPSVQYAVLCLWISAALTLGFAALPLVGVLPAENIFEGALTGLITAALLAFFAAMVNARRNWARWIFVVLTVIGSLMYAFVAVMMPQALLGQPTILQVSEVLQFALQITAVVLMFTSASRHWFSTSNVATASSAL